MNWTAIKCGASCALLMLGAAASAQTEITPPASAVTASTHDGNLPGNTVDNNLETRWSGNGDGAWIQYDLGSLRRVGAVRVAVFRGNTRNNRFDLEVSAGGGVWKPVFSGESSGTTTLEETYDFPDEDARWVRYVGHQSSATTFNSVTEISILEGAGGTPPTPTPTPSPTPTPTPTPGGDCVRTINVSTSAALSSAASGAQAGDCIVVANGSYAGFVVTRDATASAPVVIRAANRGGATLSSGTIRFNGASFVTVEGFRITTSGGSVPADGGTRKAAVSFENANDCRLTRNTLRLSGHTGSTEWVLLSGNSQRNRIDHNEFGPNSVDGHLIWPRGNPTIAGAPPLNREQWANGNGPFNPNMARHTRIDHNYFHDHLPNVTNGGEAIVTGGIGSTGDYQDTFTVIEDNLFENVYGDGELVSCKSSSTTIRYNTIRSCGGGPVSRAGNKTKIYGNFILGNNRTGSAGIRIHEMDHEIYNNYIEAVQGVTIWVGNGDPYSGGSFSHAQVKRAKIVHNTIANCPSTFRIGNAHPLPPVDLVVANNIILNSTFTGPQPMSGWTYSQNIIWPSNPGRTGFRNIDPMLAVVSGLRKLTSGSPAIDDANQGLFPFVTADMDGQPRATRDIGADEFSPAAITRRPLTTADVGPNAP